MIAFNAGEDRRGQSYRSLRATIQAPGIPEWNPTPEERRQGDKGPLINIRAMGNGKRALDDVWHGQKQPDKQQDLADEHGIAGIGERTAIDDRTSLAGRCPNAPG